MARCSVVAPGGATLSSRPWQPIASGRSGATSSMRKSMSGFWALIMSANADRRTRPMSRSIFPATESYCRAGSFGTAGARHLSVHAGSNVSTSIWPSKLDPGSNFQSNTRLNPDHPLSLSKPQKFRELSVDEVFHQGSSRGLRQPCTPSIRTTGPQRSTDMIAGRSISSHQPAASKVSNSFPSI